MKLKLARRNRSSKFLYRKAGLAVIFAALWGIAFSATCRAQASQEEQGAEIAPQAKKPKKKVVDEEADADAGDESDVPVGSIAPDVVARAARVRPEDEWRSGRARAGISGPHRCCDKPVVGGEVTDRVGSGSVAG